jgi:ubiquitin-like protein ATG12
MSTEGDENESKTANSDEITSNSTRPTADSENSERIVFLLKAAGGAPILKKKKWALPRSKTMGHIAEFLRKYMQLDTEQSKQLFLYVNQSFAPAFDTTIGAVDDCFSSEGTLVLHYTLTPAWG